MNVDEIVIHKYTRQIYITLSDIQYISDNDVIECIKIKHNNFNILEDDREYIKVSDLSILKRHNIITIKELKKYSQYFFQKGLTSINIDNYKNKNKKITDIYVKFGKYFQKLYHTLIEYGLDTNDYYAIWNNYLDNEITI